MTAARTGALAAVKALLSHGASVDAKDDRRGQTALMWAAAEGHAAVVQALIEAGADFRTRLPSGFTPLLFAVERRPRRRRPRAAEGGRGRERDDAGGKADAATAARLPPVGRRPAAPGGQERPLRAGGRSCSMPAPIRTPTCPATRSLHAITAVRNPGVGDNDPAPDGSGNMTSLELVKKLVARGANVNARMTKKANLNNTRLNEIGATPFLLAALTADAELMRTLAKLGADPSLPNADNSTPLMAAAGLATRSPGEDAGTESEVLEAVQAAAGSRRRHQRRRQQRRDRHARRGLQEPAEGREVPRRQGRQDRRLEPERQVRLDAAGDRGRLPVRQLQAVAETEAAIREVMIAAGVTPPATIVATNR